MTTSVLLAIPRACGKTYRLIRSAPVGATVLASNKRHAAALMSEIRKLNRLDVRVAIIGRRWTTKL